ncbi:transposase [Pedobacter jamesrossensis]|uniref:transposase n=1 Tax=Pedobacter jamesrossensis TaxID=1908238 RepID=UPI0036201934
MAKRAKRWKGFRLVAIDGSTSYLVNKPEVFDHFGVQVNQSTSVVMGRIMTARDVLNGVNICSQLHPINTSEQHIAYQWIPNLERDMLAIYDRGFPSFSAMYLHLEQEAPVNFVMRCKNSFNKEVSCFSQSACPDLLIEIKATNSAISELGKQGYKVTSETTVKVRLIKVLLPDGKTEILITSLLDARKYPLHLFGDLYFKRWGIETEYGMQKNYMQLELLSGYKVNTILQDFHASIFISNLQHILSIPAQTKSEKKHKDRIYSYQINRNIAIGNLKQHLINLFKRKDTGALIRKIEKLFAKYIEPVRPDRSFLRIVKGRRTKGKYQTWTNYKRAI